MRKEPACETVNGYQLYEVLQLTADSTPRVYRCGNINVRCILKVRVFGTVHLSAGLSGQLQILTPQKFLLRSTVFSFVLFPVKEHIHTYMFVATANIILSCSYLVF